MQVFCIFLFLTAASLFGTLISQLNEIVAAQTALVKSNNKVASVANDRFQGGQSSYLEVLDAERSLFNSELDLADVRRDRLLSVVEAYRALGGGWK